MWGPPNSWSGTVAPYGGEASHRKPPEVRLAPPADFRPKDRLRAAGGEPFGVAFLCLGSNLILPGAPLSPWGRATL